MAAKSARMSYRCRFNPVNGYNFLAVGLADLVQLVYIDFDEVCLSCIVRRGVLRKEVSTNRKEFCQAGPVEGKMCFGVWSKRSNFDFFEGELLCLENPCIWLLLFWS